MQIFSRKSIKIKYILFKRPLINMCKIQNENVGKCLPKKWERAIEKFLNLISLGIIGIAISLTHVINTEQAIHQSKYFILQIKF